MYIYGYVVSVAMGANKNQFIKALVETERCPGPSLIITYTPWIDHGIDMRQSQKGDKKAVEIGSWILYRYNPKLKADGKNPLILDSKDTKGDFQEFLMSEGRYSSLVNTFPVSAKMLVKKSKEGMRERYETYKRLAGQTDQLIAKTAI